MKNAPIKKKTATLIMDQIEIILNKDLAIHLVRLGGGGYYCRGYMMLALSFFRDLCLIQVSPLSKFFSYIRNKVK
jgi:hypothetical protein